jgi:predicted nucleic acid-binding protein
MIVADTNVIFSLFLNQDASPRARELFKKDPEWVAPLLWSYEMKNVLSMYVSRKFLSPKEALNIIHKAEGTILSPMVDVDSGKVLELSARSGCTAYDCEFVALAWQMGEKLITLDQKIQKSFPDIAQTI